MCCMLGLLENFKRLVRVAVVKVAQDELGSLYKVLVRCSVALAALALGWMYTRMRKSCGTSLGR